MKAAFKHFDEETIAASESAWKVESKAAGMFPAEVEQVFAWTRAHATLTDNEIAYGIFFDDIAEAFAIVEVVITQKSSKSKLIKMLKLRLRPSLEAEVYAGNLGSYERALTCYSEAFFGLYKLRGADKHAVLKFYGRSNEQLNFLKSLVGALKKRAKGHDFRMDGRWLVIEPLKAV
ncbi:MAG: hypothetical protein RLZZ618_1544 [Pseudomonadota bacterium]|jgi:hypothetical protein